MFGFRKPTETIVGEVLPNGYQPNQTKTNVQEMQIIQRREGLFNNSTEYIYHPSRFKTEEQIVKEQNQSIALKKPVGSSFFSSVKVTNVRIDGNNNSITFRI